MDAPRNTRAPAALGIVFLIASLLLSAFFATSQMAASHGAGMEIGTPATIVSLLGVLIGVAGAVVAARSQANENRRVAVLTFVFATLIFLIGLVNVVSKG